MARVAFAVVTIAAAMASSVAVQRRSASHASAVAAIDPAVEITRLLAVRAEVAIALGNLAAAEAADRARSALATTDEQRQAIDLRRINLLAGLGRRDAATALARAIILDARDPAIADDARVRLAAATHGVQELAAWIASTQPTDDSARDAGFAALWLARDPESAIRLLAPLARDHADPSLLAALGAAKRVLR